MLLVELLLLLGVCPAFAYLTCRIHSRTGSKPY